MSFTAPPQQVSFDGMLWDMDGTIIDSTAAIEAGWRTIASEIGADPEYVMQTSHGRRSIDTLKILCPERANWDYVRQMDEALPKAHGSDAKEIPGARALLDQIMPAKVPWAIVTSGSLYMVTGWFKVMNFTAPEHLITAESVDVGKPDPTCYKLGRKKLQMGPDAKVLVLEDSPAGIRSGRDAGCMTIGLLTTHTLEQVAAAKPDWIVKDLTSLRMVNYTGGKVTLEITNALASA